MDRPEPQIDTPNAGEYQPTAADWQEFAEHCDNQDHQDEGGTYDPFDDPMMGMDEYPDEPEYDDTPSDEGWEFMAGCPEMDY